MTAVLQFEVDRKRHKKSPPINSMAPTTIVAYLARTALADTFENGGTFVAVVGPEKITIVQRAEADDI